MKKINLLLFIGFGLLFGSCQSAKKAEQTANTFFELLVKQKPSAAEKLVDTGTLNTAGFSEQVKALCKNDQDGKFLSYEKRVGFNTSINNGITVVQLNYKLIYENAEYLRAVSLTDRGNGFVISSIQ